MKYKPEDLEKKWQDYWEKEGLFKVELDPKKEKFVSKGEYDLSRWANDLLKDEYRKPFVVPDKI